MGDGVLIGDVAGIAILETAVDAGDVVDLLLRQFVALLLHLVWQCLHLNEKLGYEFIPVWDAILFFA